MSATLKSSPPVRVVGSLSCQQNSYLRVLGAEVVSCTPLSTDSLKSRAKTNGTKATDTAVDGQLSSHTAKWLIEFNDSVLFPEGGGQPSDHGTIQRTDSDNNEAIKIDFVQRRGLRCVVHSPQPLEPGTSVRQEVNFVRRWDLMQQHTGQHLLTAIMNTFDGLTTLGWGMGTDGAMNYVDLPRKPIEAELEAIQKQVNDVIQQNLKITVKTPDHANTAKLPGDYDKEQGVIRVISIGNLDNNTCCGTHLQQTSHIGLLLMGPNQSYSGGRHRQFFIAGNRAINLASTSTQSIRTISRHLSCGTAPGEVLGHVTRLQDTAATLKKRETKLLAEIANYEIERVKIALDAGRSVLVHRPEPGLEFVNMVAAGVKSDVKNHQVVILASGEGSAGGALVVIGKPDALQNCVANLKVAFPAVKGGGKGERWQGKMLRWDDGDFEKLRELVQP